MCRLPKNLDIKVKVCYLLTTDFEKTKEKEVKKMRKATILVLVILLGLGLFACGGGGGGSSSGAAPAPAPGKKVALTVHAHATRVNGFHPLLGTKVHIDLIREGRVVASRDGEITSPQLPGSVLKFYFYETDFSSAKTVRVSATASYGGRTQKKEKTATKGQLVDFWFGF